MGNTDASAQIHDSPYGNILNGLNPKKKNYLTGSNEQIVDAIFTMSKNQRRFGISEKQTEEIYLTNGKQLNKFFEALQEKISNLFLGMSRMVIEKLNSKEMTENQALIYVAEQIIYTSLNIFKIIGESSDFQFQNDILEKFNTLQVSTIKYLKMIYPRGNKSYVPVQLMTEFKNLDMIEQPQFDALRLAGIYFGSEEDKDIVFKLKQMINKFIDETDSKFPLFLNLLQNQIFSLGNEDKKSSLIFQSSRAIPQTISRLQDTNQSLDEIKNPQIFQLFWKWLIDLQDYLLDPSQELLEKDYFKFILNEQKLQYRDISPEEIEDLIITLQSTLKEHQQDYLDHLKGLKSDLEAFNRNLIKIITLTDRNQKYVSKKDAQIIKYSVSNTKILDWMLMEKLMAVLKKLVSSGKSIESVLGMKMDLIKCNVTHLFSAEATGKKQEILEVFRNMKRLEEQNVIQIIKIKNNLGTALNNVEIAFKMSESFIISSISLRLSEADHSSSEKLQNIEFLNGFYDELCESPDGVVYQLAIILGDKHKIVEYESQLTFPSREIDVKKCRKQHLQNLIIQQHRRKPFICTKCARYYHVYENRFLFYHCQKCCYFMCSRCIITSKDQEYQYCLKKIKQQISKEMIRIQKLQRYFMRNAEVDVKRNALDLSGEQAIQSVKSYLNNPSQFYFLRHFSPKINTVSKEQLSSGKINQHATIGMFKGKNLILYSVIFEKRKGKTTFQFSFENQQLNQKTNLNFSYYDFIIYQKPVEVRASMESFPSVQIPQHRLVCLYSQSYEAYKNIGPQMNLIVIKNQFANDNYVYILVDIKNIQKQGNSMYGGATKNAFFKFGTISNMRKNLPDVKQTLQIYNIQDEGLMNIHLEYFKQVQWKNTIKVINLRDNNIQDATIIFTELPSIQKIVLSGNCLTYLNFPKLLPHLAKLSVSHNQISKIQSISNIPNIINLILKFNSLETFDVVKLPKLKNLDLSQNYITSIGNITSDFYPQLSVLFLQFQQYNGIQSFKISLPNLKNLELTFGSFIQMCIDQTQSLQRIQINSSVFDSLKIDYCPKIKIMDIKSALITNLAHILAQQYPHIVELIIDQNQRIKNIPEIKSPNLKKLMINRTQISTIQLLGDSELNRLQILNLSDNMITNLPQLCAPQLKEFDILDNQLQNIKAISEWKTPKLQTLSLGRLSQKTKLQNFSHFPLKKLKVVGGNVNELNSIGNITLISFELSSSKGDSLPELIMPELKELLIQQCDFMSIEKLASSNLKNLQQCKIKNAVKQSAGFPRLLSTSKLTKLIIDRNNFSNIDSIQLMDFPSLQEFQASFNKIQKIPIFKNSQKLNTLILSDNSLTSAQNLQTPTLKSLAKLTLKNNRGLINFPSLKGSKLTYLNLSNCGLIDIEWIFQSDLAFLTELNIENNPITALHKIIPQEKVTETNILKKYSNVTLPLLEKFNLNWSGCKSIQALSLISFSVLKNLQLVKIQLTNPVLPTLKFPSLTTLRLEQTNISDISSLEFSELLSLTDLIFIKNKILQLPRVNLPKLKTLAANSKINEGQTVYLKIANVDKFLTSDLPELKRVELQDNDITSLPKTNLPNLQQMFIHNNKINNLDGFVESNLPKFNLINISNNPINRLPFGNKLKPTQVYMKAGKVQDFSPLGQASLYLSRLHYNTSVIPNDLPTVNFATANRIQFEECQLVNVDHFFSSPYPLVEQISFVNNKITKAPKVICPNLKRLFFNKNKIKDVSNLMGNSDLSGLEMLSLENNQIQDLIDLPFTNPRQIFLSHNFFTDISCMSKYQYKNLQMFVAFNIKIYKICKFDTPQMTKLYLNKNQIEDISPLKASSFPLLSLIQLSDNNIKDMSVLGEMNGPNLSTIYMMNNQVQKLVSLNNLPYLSLLNISGNPVKDIKEFIKQKHNSLYTISVSFSCTSDEEYSQLTQKIRSVYINATISKKN